MRCVGIIILLSFISSFSWALESEDVYNGPAQWNEFRQYALEQRRQEEKTGLGYMISGTFAAIGGSIGYHQSEEILSRTIFALTSNVGLAAIGLGAVYYWTGNEMESFFYAIEGSTLSPQQKNEVLQRYLLKERKEKKERRWIRGATHALIALANFYSAAHEDDSEIRSVFYFLGGANTLLAVSYSF